MNNIKINKLLKYVEQFYKLAQTDAGVPAGVPTNQPLQTPTAPIGPPLPPTAPKAPNTTPEPNATPAPKQAPKRSGIGKKYLYQNAPEVPMIQQFLQQQGLYKGKLDGLFGDQTAAALMQWQKNNNLNPTGRLDQNTMSKILTQKN